MKTILAAGRRTLNASPDDAAPKRPYRVRLWYMSAGDEVLGCDSAPMSRQAAESLESQGRADGVFALAHPVGEAPDLARLIAAAESTARDYQHKAEHAYPRFGETWASVEQMRPCYRDEAAKATARAAMLRGCSVARIVTLPSAAPPPVLVVDELEDEPAALAA